MDHNSSRGNTPPRDHDEPSDEEVKTIIPARELTKFEKDQLEQSKVRHKMNIVKPQIVMGKEFKGTSFIAHPAKIIFKDFDVGRLHQQVIEMTNVSLSFNSFRLEELKDNIKDFFDIVYKPSGRIGAGISCPILVQFIPQVNEDIFDFLPLLSETGPINVPIECTSKKAIVTVEESVIDFKRVIYGGSLKKIIKFTNAGALETAIIFKNSKGTHLGLKYDATSSRGSTVYRSQKSRTATEGQESVEVDEAEEKIMSQLKFQKTAIIGGYTSLTIPIEFTPSEVGPLNFDMIAYFENYLHSPPINIKIQGECVEVPIYVEKQLYDFEICLPNHIYRERIVFFNRGKTAMKVQIEAPRETKKFFEFNPSLGYIQGESKFEIWLKLIAEPELMTICAKYSKGENVLCIPFKLIGADQVLPVEFDIQVKMTTDKIQFSPSTLNFGKLYQNTAVSKVVKIQNYSDLPQELMFYPIPKNIRILPDLIPLKILPKETLEVEVSYQGSEVLVEEAEMRCKIVTGNLAARDTKLSYRAEVLKCPLAFSHHKIEMPAVQINEKYDTNITVTNTSKNNTYVFEFFLPYFEISGLKMTPMVQKLGPGKSVDIILEYSSFFKKIGPFTIHELIEKYEKDPNKNFAYRMKMKEEEKLRQAEEEKKVEDPKAKKAPKAPEKKEVKKAPKLTKQQEKELEEETRRQQELERQREEEERQKKLEFERSFDVKGELRKLGGKFYEFGEEDNQNYSQHYEWIIPCYFSLKTGDDVGEANVCYLQVSTVTVTKRLVANRDVIDFGEMAVGFRKLEELQLTNSSSHAADLKMEMLPLFGGFSIIGALRTVDVGKTKGILVQFEPHAQQYFEETLTIYTKTSSVSVKLKGSGVNPEIKLTPESGLLNAGSVVIGDYVEKTFTIQNLSNFQLSFKLVSKAKGIQNKNGSQVFSYIPSEGKIQAHKELEVKVVFRPDRVSENFYEVVTIDVPHQKDEKSLFLAGMCFPRQAWITLHKPFVFPDLKELQKKELENPLDFVTVKDTDTVFGCGNNRILLEFKKMANSTDKDEECFFKRITIGSSKLLDPKAEKATTFEITMPKDEKTTYFTCDALKDNVPAGGSKVVTFTFKPPQPDAFIGNIDALKGIGQWIEQKAEIKIAGGQARQGFSEQFSIEVVLRAYIDQI